MEGLPQIAALDKLVKGSGVHWFLEMETLERNCLGGRHINSSFRCIEYDVSVRRSKGEVQ